MLISGLTSGLRLRKGVEYFVQAVSFRFFVIFNKTYVKKVISKGMLQIFFADICLILANSEVNLFLESFLALFFQKVFYLNLLSHLTWKQNCFCRWEIS